MAGNLLSRRKWLDHEEYLDRHRAHFLGMTYQAFIKRRAALRLQAERILRIEKRAR